jgi:hypothetical protein
MKADSHFLRLASVGHLPGCSSGEAQAYRLAQCVVANAPGLDSAALDGLVDFIYAVAADPCDGRNLLRSWRRDPR